MNSTSLEQLLTAILRPIVKYFVRKTVTFQQFQAIAKRLYVEHAIGELRAVTEKVNVSRITAITGIHRLEVSRIMRTQRSDEDRSNLHARVISQWAQHPLFTDGKGRGRNLTWRGRESEFGKLVRSVGAQINPGTVLFELERVGLAKRDGDYVKALSEVEDLSKRPDRAFQLYVREITTLAQAIEENTSSDSPKHLHIHTEYDGIPDTALPEVQSWFLETGREFHRRAREFLARFDMDLNPPLHAGPARRSKVDFVTYGYSKVDPT